MLTASTLWTQVATILRERIERGEYEIGSFLPREVDLASELSVSRNTVREAMRSLANEGLLLRKRRAGTRVLARQSIVKLHLDLDPQASLLRLSQGTQLIVQRRVHKPLPSELAAYWTDAEPGNWHRIDCLRAGLGDMQPLSWTQIYLAPDLGELSNLIGQKPGQQFRLIEEHRGEHMTRTKTTLHPVKIDASLARSLDVPTGSLGLRVMHGMINQSGACREIVVSIYPTERYTFELSFSLE